MNSPSSALLEPEEHVLSTMERDGSRRWLNPRLSRGKYLARRRIVAYLLIALFTLLPFLSINGKPSILLDVAARRFTILGYTFLPSDTLLLALFLVLVLLTIFLATALFGRVWCGWACPQTVYMEFVFRPIERWLEGTAGRGGKPHGTVAAWRIVLKYVLFLIVSVHLANTFLSYFVGVERLSQWTHQSPLEHPIPFLIVAAVTGLMLFDFVFFREQLCIIACPYGRFQSVLLDRNSLIVSYDTQRGEPRGKAVKDRTKLDLPVLGDCIDCKLCVATCPTGIDIRNGLQMECINCTQCIDACDAVMRKVGRPEGLIRYSSQAADQGGSYRWFRARTLVYPVLLTALTTLFLIILLNKKSFDAIILREPGNLHSMTTEGLVQNLLRLKLTNRLESNEDYHVSILKPASARVHVTESELRVAPIQTQTFHLQVFCPTAEFRNGQCPVRILVERQHGDSVELDFKLIGPYAKASAPH